MSATHQISYVLDLQSTTGQHERVSYRWEKALDHLQRDWYP